MNKFLHRRFLLITIYVLAFAFYFFPVGAQAFTLTPTRFELKGNPGDVISDEMLLTNENENGEAFYTSFAKFEAQGESGTPAFVDPKDGLGTWIKTEFNSVYLAPRQEKTVKFTITIPKDAEPGGHFAVIFWGNSPTSGPDGVSVGSKTGALVLLSVNGDVKEEAGLLSFNTLDKNFFFKTLPVTMEYRFKNDGGDRIKPSGTITIRNSFFIPTEKLDANPVEGNILPNSTRKFSIDWVNYKHPADYIPPTGMFEKFFSEAYYQWKNFAIGFYSAKLNLTYGAQDTHVAKTAYFFVFPWQLSLVLVLVFIITYFIGRKLLRKYNRYIINQAKAGMNVHS